MRDLAFDLLASRLRWPIPRVRWETARAIAGLVRDGHEGMRHSLVDWIAARRLEGEVVLGLGVIDAFGLGQHFDLAELHRAIGAPSILSDWLLARNFPEWDAAGDFRLAYAPDADVTLPEGCDVWFDRYRRSAVPPIFSHLLSRIEAATGLPMRARWEHEWRWLQSIHKESEADAPGFYFPNSDRGAVGQYDSGQRELYVSAYLRALHWAAREQAVPLPLLAPYATAALTLTRGLADIAPVRRPLWARAAFPATEDGAAEAAALWATASGSLAYGRRPIALDIVDSRDTGFAHFRFRLAAVPAGQRPGETPAELRGLQPPSHRGALGGRVGEHRALVRVQAPLAVAQTIEIASLGRGHVDLASDLKILSPYLTGTPVELLARPDGLVARAGGRAVSGWRYWYSDWRPGLPRTLDTRISSLAWARGDALDHAASIQGFRYAVAVSMSRGAREDSYRDMETTEHHFWLDD